MSDDYVEDTKDDYEFVISDYDGFTNDIDEKVRSNQGGSRKVNSINNVAEGSNKGRGKVEEHKKRFCKANLMVWNELGRFCWEVDEKTN